MNVKRLPLRPLLLLSCIALVGGCFRPQESKDAVIAKMIQGGLASRNNVMTSSGGLFSDYKVYRDGNQDGVVFEYVYVADAIIDRSQLTPDRVKQLMIREFSSDRDTKRVLGMGIYVRFLYKTFDGNTICDVKISSADF